MGIWQGKVEILLDKYLEDKQEFLRLKAIPIRFFTFEDSLKMAKLEKDIRIFLSQLNEIQLRDLVLMSLDLKSKREY